jgi:nucleoside-specific outer membrane channel protein Tsx
MMKPTFKRNVAMAALAACSLAVQAAEWSDTSIGWRHGTQFAEPYGANDITKNIFDLNHVSGYKYGTNFFNVDLLLSDGKDPAGVGPNFAPEGSAHEVYVVYRNTLDLEKLTGSAYKFGPVRGVGITGGFDFNAKTDAGYNSKKHMIVLGPTLMFDVPGFLNVSLLALWESNAPCNYYNLAGGTSPCVARYSYKTHPMLTAAWGIPLGKDTGLSFEGFANFIASKGTNEYGGPTAAETNIDMQVMYDLGGVFGAKPGTFKIGFEYQYWRNKFGNPTTGALNPAMGQAGPGATAKTPMIRAEYHF